MRLARVRTVEGSIGVAVLSEDGSASLLDLSGSESISSLADLLHSADPRAAVQRLVDAGTTDVGRTDIHGISPEWLHDAPRFAEIAGDLAAQLDGCILVAHNAPFDVGFIVEEWGRAGLGTLNLDAVDTLPLARSLGLPGRLGLLAAALEVPLDDAHQALDDTRALAGVLVALLEQGAQPPVSPIFGPPLLTPAPTGRVLHRPGVAV